MYYYSRDFYLNIVSKKTYKSIQIQLTIVAARSTWQTTTLEMLIYSSLLIKPLYIM